LFTYGGKFPTGIDKLELFEKRIELAYSRWSE